MALKLSLQEATDRGVDLMFRGYHWGPSVLQVMWEATDLGSEDLLWATTNFMGGIAGQREGVCGAISGAAVFLGLRHRVPLANKERADRARQASREKTVRVVQAFKKEHGTIICGDLLGIDFSDAAAVQRFRDSGQQREKCSSYLRSVIKMLYELEEKWEAECGRSAPVCGLCGQCRS